MELLSSVALVLVSMAAYSGGWTLAAGSRRLAPGLFDLGIVLALWIAAFALRSELGRWPALAAAVSTAAAMGAARVALTRRPAAEPHPEREPTPPADASLAARWKRFAMEMGNVQGRLTMGFFYFVVVTPFALLSKLTGRTGTASSTSYWRERDPQPTGMQRARNQF